MKSLFKHREVWLVLAIAALIAVVATRFPGFARPANLATVFNDTSILIVLALGQTAVILTRSSSRSARSPSIAARPSFSRAAPGSTPTR